MTAARVASPEGWQVSVRLAGDSCGSVLGAGGLVLGRLVVGALVAEGSLVEGLVVDGLVVGRWLASGLVLGGLVVAALVVVLAGVMKVAALMVRWCWRAGRETGLVVGVAGGGFGEVLRVGAVVVGWGGGGGC